jgi:hypothetical protein
MALPLYDWSGPRRPPNWRWELATDDSDRPFRRCTDPVVRAARRFWRSRVPCRTEADRRLLAARMPLLSQAFGIYCDPAGLTRSALEARTLAAEPVGDIARKSAVPAAVVEVYEQVFFDIRDRLTSPDFIGNEVLGPRLRTGGPWPFDLVWKFFGFIGGVRVLDELTDVYHAAPRPTNPEEAVTFLSEATRTLLGRQLAAAARSLGGDRRAAAELLLAQARPEGQSGDGGAPRTVYEQHIAALLKELPWASGANASKVAPAVAELDRAAAELRADELLRLAAGEQVPEASALKELQLPPPRSKAKPPSILEPEF